MALSTDLTLSAFNQDVIIKNAYIKIDSIFGDKSTITLNVGIYQLPEKIELTRKGFSFTQDLDGKNVIAQGYEYLKTLPEFSDAIDC
jgi:hypothetical protein